MDCWDRKISSKSACLSALLVARDEPIAHAWHLLCLAIICPEGADHLPVKGPPTPRLCGMSRGEGSVCVSFHTGERMLLVPRRSTGATRTTGHRRDMTSEAERLLAHTAFVPNYCCCGLHWSIKLHTHQPTQPSLEGHCLDPLSKKRRDAQQNSSVGPSIPKTICRVPLSSFAPLSPFAPPALLVSRVRFCPLSPDRCRGVAVRRLGGEASSGRCQARPHEARRGNGGCPVLVSYL